jgi:hypothetical protein
MLTVKKSGLYVSEYRKRPVKVHSYIPFLSHTIKFEDNITFEDFFKYIIKDTKSYSMVFSSHLGHFDLKDWEEEWRTPIDLDYIYVKWIAEYTDWSKRVGKHEFGGIKYEITDTHKEIEIHVDFSGWGKMKKSEYGNDTSDELVEVSFAIEMTPINQLKALPFKLNEDFQLYELTDSKILVNGIKEFTVYDVIGSVLYEISFAGPPEEREVELSKIKESLKQVEQKNFTEYKFGDDKEKN